MNNNNFEKFIRKMKSIKMTKKEEAEMRSRLEIFISNSTYTPSPYQVFFSYTKRTLALSLIVFISFGFISKPASSNSLPGDTLYPVKIIHEEITSATKKEGLKKIQFEISRTEKRIQEATTLLKQENLSKDEEILITKEIVKQTEKVRDEIEKIKIDAPEDALVLNTELKTTIQANTKALKKISRKKKTKKKEVEESKVVDEVNKEDSTLETNLKDVEVENLDIPEIEESIESPSPETNKNNEESLGETKNEFASELIVDSSTVSEELTEPINLLEEHDDIIATKEIIEFEQDTLISTLDKEIDIITKDINKEREIEPKEIKDLEDLTQVEEVSSTETKTSEEDVATEDPDQTEILEQDETKEDELDQSEIKTEPTDTIVSVEVEDVTTVDETTNTENQTSVEPLSETIETDKEEVTETSIDSSDTVKILEIKENLVVSPSVELDTKGLEDLTSLIKIEAPISLNKNQTTETEVLSVVTKSLKESGIEKIEKINALSKEIELLQEKKIEDYSPELALKLSEFLNQGLNNEALNLLQFELEKIQTGIKSKEIYTTLGIQINENSSEIKTP